MNAPLAEKKNTQKGYRSSNKLDFYLILLSLGMKGSL